MNIRLNVGGILLPLPLDMSDTLGFLIVGVHGCFVSVMFSYASMWESSDGSNLYGAWDLHVGPENVVVLNANAMHLLFPLGFLHTHKSHKLSR
jgi:hypothetical protein